jgi:hypothetical protein
VDPGAESFRASVTLSQGRYVLHFEATPPDAFLREFSQIPGRRFDPDKLEWSVRANPLHADAFAAFCRRWNIAFRELVRPDPPKGAFTNLHGLDVSDDDLPDFLREPPAPPKESSAGIRGKELARSMLERPRKE